MSPAPDTPLRFAPLPYGGSVVVMLLVVAAAVAWAWADTRAPSNDAPRTMVKAEKTLVRDVLTGRLTMSDGTPEPPAEGPGSPGKPLRLRFVPSSDAAQGEAAIKPLIAFLKERTGYAIEGAILRSYGLVVQAIIEGQCDVAFLTAASYARAHNLANKNGKESDDIEPILAAVRQGNPKYPGSDLAYRAAILVRADSDLKDLADLQGRTVAMGGPTSGASSILPSALFNEMGIAPRIQRYEGYPVIIQAVLQGATDAGCIFWSPPGPDGKPRDARILLDSTDPKVWEKTRILGYTGWIPNEPVVVRAAIPDEVKDVLRRAIALYVITKSSTEAGRKELQALGSVRGYIPATGEDYKPLHEAIERAFLNDPEGRRDFMSSRR